MKKKIMCKSRKRIEIFKLDNSYTIAIRYRADSHLDSPIIWEPYKEGISTFEEAQRILELILFGESLLIEGFKKK